jgi:hypothetical protein
MALFLPLLQTTHFLLAISLSSHRRANPIDSLAVAKSAFFIENDITFSEYIDEQERHGGRGKTQ